MAKRKEKKLVESDTAMRGSNYNPDKRQDSVYNMWGKVESG